MYSTRSAFLFAGFFASLLASLTTLPAQDRRTHPYAMKYGPVIGGTWEAQWPRDNIALKGLAIRVGGGKAQVVFDTELLRVAAVALGHYQELRGTQYDGAHGPVPRLGGRQLLATPNGPGWTTGASFADPRRLPYGPLPRRQGRFKGYYLDGERVVLRYEVGGTDVMEAYAAKGEGAARTIHRRLDIGPGRTPLRMLVGMRQGARASVEGGLGLLRYEIPAAGAVSAERGSMAWEELAMGPPVRDDYADRASVNGVETRLVRGKANRRSGVRAGVVTRFHDGEYARNWEDTSRIAYFDGRGTAKLVTDLKKSINLGQVNTYSWHRGNRAAQKYELYGSDAATAPSVDSLSGWQLIAKVDTTGLGNGGLHAVRIAKGSASLARVRYLLWVLRKPNTWFTEIDIFEAMHRPAAHLRPRAGSFVTAVGLAGTGGRLVAKNGALQLEVTPGARRQQLELVIFDGAARALGTVRQAVAAARPKSLVGVTRGGRGRWGGGVTTRGALGKTKGAYVVDRLTVPTDRQAGSHLRFAAFDFFRDGRAALSTWNGDVWIVSGIDATLTSLRWRRFATGLFDPLGLKIVGGVIHTLGRDGITRLHDLNRDGEADFYECFNNDVMVTRNFHEFAFDLQTDKAGNFYFAKAGPVRPGGRGFDKIAPHHGCVLKVSKDGRKLEVFATGLRAPNGLAVHPQTGIVTSGDNEGTWMPCCRLNWIKQGTFNGCVPTAHRDRAPTAYDPPLCFLPMRVDNSSGGQLWVTTDKWGPFRGDLLHLSYGQSRLFKVVREEVEGVVQGGVVPFPLRFTSSCMRARQHPTTGQVFVVGLRGWQTNAVAMTGFDRVRYTGKPVRMLTKWRTSKTGIALTFTCALDPREASDVRNYEIEAWNYLWTRRYGSPEVSTKHFDPNARKTAKPVHDAWRVTAAKLSEDGKTVFLTIPDIEPVMQVRVKFDLEAKGGERVKSELHASIHKLAK